MPGRGSGPPNSRIMLIGDAWGSWEEQRGESFVGPSGDELNRMLHEAGILRSECFVTNVVNARPPSNLIELWRPKKKKDITPDMVPLRGSLVKPILRDGYEQMKREISLVRPNIIVALGGTALWALTGAEGILKWRGSQIWTHGDPEIPRIKVIPTIHPASVLREWSQRFITIHDLKRAAAERHSTEYSNEPKWNFIVRPTIDQALETLSKLESLLTLAPPEGLWLDFDLETRSGHIACAGLSWSRTEAICLPFMCVERREGYWLPEEESHIVHALYHILTHPNVRVRGQNLLYDCQYTYRHWHFVPRVAQDTMIAHHSVFCGLPKSLAFQASMYCNHYVYWKDDGKTWTKDMGEEQLWRYNQIDCIRTREVGEVSTANISKLGLESVDAFQQKFFWPVLQAMQRGVAIDKKLRGTMALELQEEMSSREEYFRSVLGHPLNPKSPKQMQELFYNDLKCRPNWSKPKPGLGRTLTLDDKALEKISHEESILTPLIRAIQEYRSLGVFLSTFVLASLDVDGRMRTSYNICGTETYRFSSSENAFGSGTNLQNIPKGGDDDDSGLRLPNVRRLFIPDPGFTIFDTDLSKADLRIVAWESDEPELKAMLKEGRDPYVETAREFYHDPTIRKTRDDGSEDPRYKTFKSFAHGSHYLGTPRGLSQRLGLTVAAAKRTQRWYFGKYPAIRRWQDEFKARVAAKRYVENIFGYRRYYFDRPDDAMFREAIAWLPQSTVALYINRIWMNLYEKFPHIWILLQVHDSLMGQFPTFRKEECLRQLGEASQIVLPYADPLIIPVGIKTSERSWGDCE
jgi:DNA polymerase I-like protein with 3'-5' exonuclease and polymerase domains/uracil-DNA glycosylase